MSLTLKSVRNIVEDYKHASIGEPVNLSLCIKPNVENWDVPQSHILFQFMNNVTYDVYVHISW